MHLKTTGLPTNESTIQWSPESVTSESFPYTSPQLNGWNDGYTLNPSPTNMEWQNPSLSPPIFQQPEEEVWNAFTNLGSPGSSGSESSSPSALLPGFIQPLPMMMNPTTIEFLYVNGVFTLPNTQLQNILLQTFLECVLPSMPIIEWPAFMNAISNRDTDHGSVSLLLFHAMMASATTFVDIGHLQDAGFSTRQEAQEAFYNKAKLLYQSEYEPNTIIVVQALLLMTYRIETADGEDSRYWSSIAISTAQCIGLFRDVSGVKNVRLNPKFWKRLAWTCYITDCQIALRLRCRPIIQNSVFCHGMLTEDDFDWYNLSADSLVQIFGYPLSHSMNVQRDLALMCVANAQLCSSISEVLDLQNKETSRHGSFSSSSPHTTLTDAVDHETRVSVCESNLAQWASKFPSSIKTYPFESPNMEDEPAISLQRGLLHLQFYTAIAVFYQSHPLPSSNFCIPYAAQQITQIASELYQKKLHRRLPIVGVTAILVALIISISEMKKEPTQEGHAVQSFQLGLEVMADLRDVYREANSITLWAMKMMDNMPFDGVSPYSDRRMSVTSAAPHLPGLDFQVMSVPQVM
ncbi:hypothetical protein N7478_008941 [Penicillium angulare]|uniref:uncharacterized protein n=1 Tax=Penicillium angulare TaxID=116970 RepID=UPI0025421F36|nr:uncharacterized protein N7478_008941 [Penicillium angulare]KAJ5273816.1 hypothetical protein N7478_008941 [Penicillium angulare]